MKIEHQPEIIICGGGAKPEDTHLASIVHCIDNEIIDWLKRRERRKRKCREKNDHARS